MRLRTLFTLWCVAAIIGCSEDNREDSSVSQTGESTVDQPLLHDLREEIVQRSEPVPPPDREQPGPLPSDIRPLRRIPIDDGDVLDAQPLLSPPPSSGVRDGAVPNRTALAPAPARASSSRRSGSMPFTTIRVFYGTNRNETGAHNPKETYGTRQGETTFGFCDVSIPRNHQAGQLETPSIWRFEFREDPQKHVVLLGVQQQSRSRFLSALRQQVWDSMAVIDAPDGPVLHGGEVFIFVHGYNNTFEDAARRTAQIAHDLKFQGAPVMYSWPSQARSSLEAYRHDGNMAGWSEEHLIEFVTTVARESGARRVHLIAHSMGNRIVSGALRRLVEQTVSGRIPKFNEVILSAPDIDADYFKTAIAPRIVHSADRITIYSSSRDYALKLSSFFNPQARKRLGEAGNELTVFPEYDSIDVIDATQVETDLFALNHSYMADSPSILADMSLLLQGYSTEQRGLASVFNQLAWQIRNVGRQISEGVTPSRQ